MNDNERAALVEELAEAMWLSERDDTEGHEWHGDVRETGIGRMILREARACLPIIDRLLATTPEPDIDALLDSVHPEAAITRMERNSRHKWHITIRWVTVPDTSPVLHTFTGIGPTRMEAIAAAVAQATGITQEGASE